MIERYENVIIDIVCSVMVPLIQLFALYVVVHGHYGPGGGFQGGVLFAVSIILLRLCLGKEASHKKFPPKLAAALAASGMLVYMLTGLAPMAAGGAFLDYGHLPIPGVSGAELRFLGITIVEWSIAFSVCGTMVLLFDVLAEGMR
ncbi:MAG: sodium:proton antiporter [Chloroflexi bacterium]|nr:sodium:proton antiporter [Chloroflexota bacterium]